MNNIIKDKLIEYRNGSISKNELYQWLEKSYSDIEPLLKRTTFLKLKSGEPGRAIIELIPPCKTCNSLPENSEFENIYSFEKYCQTLSTLEQTGKLLIIKEPDWLNIERTHLGAAAFYKCARCGSVWHLAIPERAFKGFWKRIC